MFGKRALTALIGAGAAIYIINFGQGLFAAAVCVLAVLAWLEYGAIFQRKQFAVSHVLGLPTVILLLACALYGNSQELIFVMMASMLIIMSKPVLYGRNFTIEDAAITLLGVLYIGLPFAHMLMLRSTDSSFFIHTSFGVISAGAAYLWLAFIGTWASDTFAYLIGCRWGKHKLCPSISPNKTVEGTVSGLLGSTIAVGLFGLAIALPLNHALIIGLLVGIAAPFGDLVESSIKRFAGVKDSGKILPGHGGVLDRFDSILFTVPVVYYYVIAFIIRL